MAKAVATHDFFAVTNASSKPKKTSKPEVAKVEIEGLRCYAAVDYMTKALSGLSETLKASIEEQMVTHFVEEGTEKKGRPANFRGTDGEDIEASLELRKRSSRSILDDEEVALCKNFGIETQVVNTYTVNMNILTPELMARISKALSSDPAIPKNLFDVEQKHIVTDNSLKDIFSKGKDIANQMIRVCGTLAIKPVFHDTFEKASEIVRKLMDDPAALAAKDTGPSLMDQLKASLVEEKKTTTRKRNNHKE